MRFTKGRRIAAFLMLCVFVGIYMVFDREWILPRKLLLASQITTGITWIGPKLAVLLVILVCTALLGRWYCSLLCPAGLVQEAFTRLGRRLGLCRLGHAESSNPVAVLAVFALLGIAGFTLLLNVFDPLGLFGCLAQPLGEQWRRLVHGVDGAFPEGTAALVALAFGVAVLVVIPLFFGRLFCDRCCPVGALLKVACTGRTRRIRLSAETCVSCAACERVCQARCLDGKGKTIDPQRCLLCLDCLEVCQPGALSYGRQPAPERRAFLGSAVAGLAAGLYVISREIRGRLPRQPAGAPPVIPPGMTDRDRRDQRCVTCQACIPSCPVGIIRPGPDSRPVLDFDRGYCQYNCALCSRSCPAGAFTPLSHEEKHTLRIARTLLHIERCIVVVNGTACGACAEVCPTHAVSMRELDPSEPTLPDFDPAYCIGCGACYHVCPTEPRSFTVTGLERHERSRGIRPWSHPAATGGDIPKPEGELQEFPF